MALVTRHLVRVQRASEALDLSPTYSECIEAIRHHKTVLAHLDCSLAKESSKFHAEKVRLPEPEAAAAHIA